MSKIAGKFLLLFIASPAWAYTPADLSANANVVAFLNWLEYIRDKAGTTQKMVVGHLIQANDTANDWNNTLNYRYNLYVEQLYTLSGTYVSGIGSGGFLASETAPNAKARLEAFWNAGAAFVYAIPSLEIRQRGSSSGNLLPLIRPGKSLL